MIIRYIKSMLSAVNKYRKIDAWCVIHNASVITNLDIPYSLTRSFALLALHKSSKLSVIQVGAHTGEGSHDIPDILALAGVSSVLIEPQPAIYRQLVNNFSQNPGIKTINAAIDTQRRTRYIHTIRQECNIFHVRGGKFGRSIGSFEKSHVIDYFRRNCTFEGQHLDDSEIVESVPVEAITVQDLLGAEGVNKPDILLIDAEGFDHVILGEFLAANVRPKFIRFEHAHLNGLARPIWEKLKNLGFKLIICKSTRETIAIDTAYYK